MSMQLFTRLKAVSYLLGLLLSVVSAPVLGQTTVTFDDQGYEHNANLGRTITIGNFQFSVVEQDLSTPASTVDETYYDIYYESSSEANGFGGSGLIYVGDQFDTDDPFYFIVKTVDGTEQDFRSVYIYDYIHPDVSFSVNLTAEAYRNGTLLGSQDLIIPRSSKATYTLDPVFNNVDEIRFRQQTPLKYAGYPGVIFAFDQFVIGAPLPANNNPTDISLSNSSVNKSAGVNATVGTLSSADADAGDTHTYALVAGSGDDGNAGFHIDGSTLRANNALSLAAGTHSVRIRTTDSKGGTYEEAFTITVANDLPITPGDPGNFITTWTTEDPGSGIYQIIIPTTGAGYNYTVYWEEVGNAVNSGIETGVTGDLTIGFSHSGTYKVEISGDFPRIYLAKFQPDLFEEARKLLSVEQWGDIAWTSMEGAFTEAGNLQVSATDIPDLSRVTSMARMFEDAVSFNAPIGNWDVSNVTDMSYLFEGAVTFNQDLGDWDVSNVTNMAAMFNGANNFNGDISGWNVGNVTSMAGMFVNGYAFNQNIGGWDVGNVTDMTSMFRNATAFNQDISGWDVSKVTKLQRTFFNAAAFNQDIGGWDVSNVTDMFETFSHAGSFNQDISSWEISNVITMGGMLDASGFSGENYDALLIGWAAQSNLPADISLGAEGLVYCAGAEARLQLIEDHGWTIGGDTPGCSSMLIYVDRETGNTIVIRAEPSDAIQQVKQKIEDKTGISAATQQLSFAGDQLEDGRTLADYNILNGSTLSLTIVAASPVVTTSGGATTFTEPFDGGPARAVIDNALTVNDPDNSTLASAMVTITGNFQPGEDVLNFTGDGSTMGNITGSYNATGGMLTLTSEGSTATLAEWQAALRAVTYSNNSQVPNTAVRTVSFVADDGSLSSSPATKTVNVIAVNSRPVAVDDAVTTSEDIPVTGNVLTNDSDPEGDQLTASVVTVPVSGRVVLNTDGSFTYTPNRDHNGTDKLQYQVCDNGSPSVCNTAWINFTIEDINDAPEITAPASINIDEDVSTPLTGISFADADAGSGSVTVTFSAAAGTLAATSGGGVTAGGPGTDMLTLAGAIADLNAFIAAGNLTFTTALNATAAVTLSVETDDGGHTGADPGDSGTGSSEADAATVTLNVNAVNDAPVNTVPAAQAVDGDGFLVFSAGSGNRISVSDADAGGGEAEVTLTANNGLITLPGTVGLVFSEGDGLSDGSMVFKGTIADINQALNGMTFFPAAGYSGAASLQIATSDLGLTGSGGVQTDTDVINITVNAVNPVITAVNAGTADGTYKLNDVIPITITCDQAVMVNNSGGVPGLLLETGATDRQAVYTSGSGSNTLTFNYTVQAGDLSADLDYASTTALALNGATIQNSAGMDAVLTLPPTGGAGSIAGQHNIVVDGAAPAVNSVAVPANGYYRVSDVLNFTVTLSEPVVVNTGGGIPYLELTIGTATAHAAYISGSGSDALLFRYTVQAGEQDLDGIEPGSSITLNGGTIRDAAGNDVKTALNNVAPTNNVFVYSARPGVTLSTAAISPVNQPFTLNIVFTEAVTGFDLKDITVVNATLGPLQTTDNIRYTSRVTPLADGTVSLEVPAGAAQNIASNDNTASNTLELTYDAAAPAIPQGLAARPLNGAHVIDWAANTESDLAAYALYGAATPNPTTLLARIDAPATTYTHTGVTGGVTWYYRLAAIDEAGNESGLSEEVTAIVKIGQEITFAPEATVTYGTADFAPGASSTNSSIDIAYSSSDEAIAGIVGGMIHVRKAGTVTITASQEGNALYNEAVPRDQVLTIRKAPLTITAENKSRKYGEENPVFTFTYAGFVNGEDESHLSAPPSASTKATPLSPPGKYPIIADGAAAANYAPRYVNGTLTVVPAARSLTFAPLPEKTYGDADFTPGAESNTEETIIYSSSNTAVAEIADGKIHIQGAGSAIITATLPENPNYENTPEVSRELLVNKAPQEILFAEIGQVQRNAGTLQLDVSASSGLPVQLEVSNELVATLTGPAGLQVLRLGSTIVTATQPGNANYLPAAPVERELLVVDQAGERVRVSRVVSPNSDGINDFLIIEGISDFPDNNLVIVNRNGVAMFETRGYDNGSKAFRGQANTRVIGENLPAGTYFYLLEYRRGSETRRQKGWFVLKYQ